MALVQQAVQSRDTDVVQAFHVITHQFRRAGGFLRDGQVGRAGGNDEDRALATSDVLLPEGNQARDRQVGRVGNHFFHGIERILVRAGHQQGGTAAHNLPRDGGHLGRCFA